MTILIPNNFLFYKLIFKLVTIVTNNFWSPKLIVNESFFLVQTYQINFITLKY